MAIIAKRAITKKTIKKTILFLAYIDPFSDSSHKLTKNGKTRFNNATSTKYNVCIRCIIAPYLFRKCKNSGLFDKLPLLLQIYL